MPIYFEPRKKAKALLVLFLIILVVMLNNFSDREDYADLDRTVSSIYNDRLMPAGFLFQINHHLYQKRILEQSDNLSDAAVKNKLQEHNSAIAGIIKNYEKTYLTQAEKKQWNNFKSHLNNYNLTELNNMNISDPLKVAGSKEKLHASFDQAIISLNNLNDIQAKEGNVLQRHSKSVIGDTLLHSYLEVSLLFIVCIIVLVLSGFTDQYDKLLHEKHLLN